MSASSRQNQRAGPWDRALDQVLGHVAVLSRRRPSDGVAQDARFSDEGTDRRSVDPSLGAQMTYLCPLRQRTPRAGARTAAASPRRAHAQLGQDARHVVRGGLARDHQDARRSRGCCGLRDEAEHLQLAGGEADRVGRGGSDRAAGHRSAGLAQPRGRLLGCSGMAPRRPEDAERACRSRPPRHCQRARQPPRTGTPSRHRAAASSGRPAVISAYGSAAGRGSGRGGRPASARSRARRWPSGAGAAGERDHLVEQLGCGSDVPGQPAGLSPCGCDRPQPLQVARAAGEVAAPHRACPTHRTRRGERRSRPSTVTAMKRVMTLVRGLASARSASRSASSHRPWSSRQRASHPPMYEPVSPTWFSSQ